MSTGFEHLSDAQLEHYGTNSLAVTPEEEQRIEAHLEDCDQCRSAVLETQRIRFGLFAGSSVISRSKVDHGAALDDPSDAVSSSLPLRAIRDPYTPASSCILSKGPSSNPSSIAPSSIASSSIGPSFGGPSSNGPSQDDLRDLAAGILSPDKALAMTQHAAECEHCASLLRAFMEDFSNDLTPDDLVPDDLTPDDFTQGDLAQRDLEDEKAFLSQLKSSSPKWQEDMARQAMEANRGTNASSTSGAKIFGWPIRRVLAPAAIAASALIAFGLWFTQRDTPEKVEKLLAQAYTEQRTMEYRWPGAEWGPVRVTRGPGQSELPAPVSLLKAERVVAERQVRGTSDPQWLGVKGEAELLQNELPAAIADLSVALMREPNSSRLKLLLAIAYAQQGDVVGERASKEKALALLDAAMADSEYTNAVRFNRGLLLNQLDAKDKAIEEWNNLLRYENEGVMEVGRQQEKR